MREEYLHYLWKFQHYDQQKLVTSDGDQLEVQQPGFINNHAGPDFSQASILLHGMLWHGPVEIHVKSSDWFKHGHHKDPAYDHVILHVVFINDQDAKTINGRILPTLELKDRVDQQHLEKFKQKLPTHRPIPCGAHVGKIDTVFIRSWIHRMAIDRLESKWKAFTKILNRNPDWNQAVTIWLARAFGFGINGDAFQHMAEHIDWKFFIKYQHNPLQLIALVFGQAGWLGEHGRLNHAQLNREYNALQQLHSMYPMSTTHWNYGKVHPANQPHKRALQWIIMQSSEKWSLKTLDDNTSIQELTKIVRGNVELLQFANQLYPEMFTPIGVASINGILSNAILPLQYFRAKWLKADSRIENVINNFHRIPPEVNHITRSWKALGVRADDRLESQGLIQLFRTLCSCKKCLSCLVGLQTLKPSSIRHETDL